MAFMVNETLYLFDRSGDIICPTFVEHMINHALRLKLSTRAVNLMNILIEESLCVQESTTTKLTTCDSDVSSCVGIQTSDLKDHIPAVVSSSSHTIMSMNGTETDTGKMPVETLPPASTKRKLSSEDPVIAKKVKPADDSVKPPSMPPFYFNLHKRQIKLVNLPRYNYVFHLFMHKILRISSFHAQNYFRLVYQRSN